jgi:hypothetical protein
MLEMMARPLLMSIALWAAATVAETTLPLRVGDPLPALSFDDQFERSHRLGDCGALVLFAPDRAGADMVKQALNDVDGEAMAARGLCYVADVSAMPGVITRMFALPAMRDYGYPVLLGLEAEATKALPRQAEAVTAIAVDDGRVAGIAFAATAAAVRAAIDASAGTPGLP